MDSERWANFWKPSTLYFRTQDEAYSYGERRDSGWNPVVGACPLSPTTCAWPALWMRRPPQACAAAERLCVRVLAEWLLQQTEVQDRVLLAVLSLLLLAASVLAADRCCCLRCRRPCRCR